MYHKALIFIDCCSQSVRPQKLQNSATGGRKSKCVIKLQSVKQLNYFYDNSIF